MKDILITDHTSASKPTHFSLLADRFAKDVKSALTVWKPLLQWVDNLEGVNLSNVSAKHQHPGRACFIRSINNEIVWKLELGPVYGSIEHIQATAKIDATSEHDGELFSIHPAFANLGHAAVAPVDCVLVIVNGKHIDAALSAALDYLSPLSTARSDVGPLNCAVPSVYPVQVAADDP